MHEFPIPAAADGAVATPSGITAGPDDNVWFADPNEQTISRITLPAVCASDAGATH